MNKQEAIEKIEAEWFSEVVTNLKDIIDIVNMIDEPQKVVVPKFVAEWIEGCKRSGWHLQKVIYKLDDDDKIGDWAYDENEDLIYDKVDMIARAWLDGYTVEKEKLYTVEIPNPNLNAHVVLQKTGDGIALVTVGNTGWAELESSKLTESEIKQDFDFLWQWAKGVEAEK